MVHPLGNPKFKVWKHFKTEQPIIQAVPFLFLGALLFCSLESEAFALEGGAVSPAAGVASPAPSALPTSVAPLTELQRKQLELEFSQALRVERSALEHQLGLEWRALKDSQRSREREWKAREKTARREFFQSNARGAEKTKWMENRKKRYQEFKADLLGEKKRIKAEQAVRKKSLDEDQKSRTQQLREALKAGVYPAVSLWHPTRAVPMAPSEAGSSSSPVPSPSATLE
jgi:hypothetical protein